MSNAAVLKLAKLKEKYLPDHEGREQAGIKLLEEFLGACKSAGLSVVEEKGFQKVSLWHPPQVHVLVSTAGGEILIGQGARQKAVTGLEYDPIGKLYTGPDPEVGIALDIVTEQVARALETKASDTRRTTQRPDPEDDPDYQDVSSRGSY